MITQAVLTAPHVLELRDVARRELAPFEARIAVSRAGICGTDLAIFNGHYRVALPLVMGHEFSGKVIELGSNAPRDLLGKRCTAEINNSCLARMAEEPCEACRRGMPGHCQTRSVVGIDRWEGAFASEIIVPAANVHVLPESMSDEVAVFIEPLAAALQTFEMAPLGRQGEQGFPPDGAPWVVVLGVGRLGLLVAAAAKSLGARVIGITRSAKSIERARAYCDVVLGADRPDLAVTFVREQTAGLGADYVVEATASPLGLHFAAQLVRPRGVIAMKSTPGLGVDGLNMTALVVNEIRLQGSRCGPFDKAIEFMTKWGRLSSLPDVDRLGADAGQAGKPAPLIDFTSLISARYPLPEIMPALEAATEATKVIIECGA